jgi:hypothetical protein
LDTRFKIVSREAALERVRGKQVAIVTGYFDPLQVEHVRRLNEIRSSHELLIVLLADPPDPILDAASRAQLIAALDMIDYVVLPQECASSVDFERAGRVSVYPEEAADEARFQRLLEHVHRRHRQPVHP